MGDSKNRIGARVTDAVVILAAAIVIAAAFTRNGTDQDVRLSKRDWDVLVRGGTAIGSNVASATLVEFVDYQCPVCARLEGVVSPFHGTHSNSLRRVIRHYPLSNIHAEAEDAAVAFECAGVQGRAAQMHTELLADQHAIKNRDWRIIAQRAGVSDTLEFQRCLASEEPRRKVRSDFEMGNAMGVTGTPTFILDRVWLPGGSPPQLRERIQRALR